jgi:hypothetical protein
MCRIAGQKDAIGVPRIGDPRMEGVHLRTHDGRILVRAMSGQQSVYELGLGRLCIVFAVSQHELVSANAARPG